MSYSWTTPVEGPGDHRPTAQHIIETEALVGKLSDKVILITYGDYGREELSDYAPRVVHVDGRNRVVDEVASRLDTELALTEPA